MWAQRGGIDVTSGVWRAHLPWAGSRSRVTLKVPHGGLWEPHTRPASWRGSPGSASPLLVLRGRLYLLLARQAVAGPRSGSLSSLVSTSRQGPLGIPRGCRRPRVRPEGARLGRELRNDQTGEARGAGWQPHGRIINHPVPCRGSAFDVERVWGNLIRPGPPGGDPRGLSPQD